MDLDSLRWRKSSRSVNDDCVEVALWRKSSFSGPEADCVEVGLGDGSVCVRDTKDRTAGHLTLPEPTWHTFLTTVTR